MHLRHRRRWATIAGGATLAAAGLAGIAPAAASAVTPGTLFQLPANAACLKGHGNCSVYPKAAALPGGRLVAAFEKATVAPSGSADGEPIPLYKSDDDGTTWQYLTDVKAPRYLSDDAAYARYVSNWTNPYLYVLPQAVGSLAAGTLLMASVVSGDDAYYLQQKAANPGWTPTDDGDRRDMAIALYQSTDSGATWSVVNIITNGGWQGGNGANIAAANTSRQRDPVWEPYLMVYDNQLVAYYSDEMEYTAYNAGTGVLTVAPNNTTGADPGGQVIAHRTWNGTGAWSAPVLDVAGGTGTYLGGGRPGMPNVVPTSDGKWLMTYEYWGGGDNVRYKVSGNPLNFWSAGGDAGTGITSLPVTAGSGAITTGGSPVLLRLPNGRILYNSNAGGGDVWVNGSGSSTGAWAQVHTTQGSAYSRNLTYAPRTGRVEIIGGTTRIVYSDVDFGNSAGPYYKLVNRKSSKALDVYQNNLVDGAGVVQWADNGGANQQWHLTDIGGGYRTLLNRNSGRALGIWQGNQADAAIAVQWVQTGADDQAWQLVAAGSYYKLIDRHAGKALTVAQGSAADGAQVIQWPDQNLLEQQWSLVQVSS
ncbi:RICIN domain-containing protein [Dactylosporangium sp. NPDC049140]|uniref:RICIN domain-containing protein n=1 Tax=Dactylosporangium sp. NPDC049140 TaxID=3155647 RepID=UPI0033D39D53